MDHRKRGNPSQGGRVRPDFGLWQFTDLRRIRGTLLGAASTLSCAGSQSPMTCEQGRIEDRFASPISSEPRPASIQISRAIRTPTPNQVPDAATKLKAISMTSAARYFVPVCLSIPIARYRTNAGVAALFEKYRAQPSRPSDRRGRPSARARPPDERPALDDRRGIEKARREAREIFNLIKRASHKFGAHTRGRVAYWDEIAETAQFAESPSACGAKSWPTLCSAPPSRNSWTGASSASAWAAHRIVSATTSANIFCPRSA